MVPPISKRRAITASRKLPKPLVNAARHGRCQIQAAASGVVSHGKSQQVIRAKYLSHPLVNVIGRPAGFIAKEQVIAALQRRLPMRARGVRCIQPHIVWPLALYERVPTFVLAQVQQMPVIQAGASHGLLIHVKCDWANHMEPTPSDHGGASHISRVVGNLRMNQDNVENGIQWCVIHVKRGGVRLNVWTPKREDPESIARWEYFVRYSRHFEMEFEISFTLAIREFCGYTFEIMMEVLLVNLAWVLLMAVWGVSYFIQARADRAKGGRYIANLEPESKD